MSEISIIGKLSKNITETDKKSLFWSFLFGVLTHLYMLVNKFPLYDDLAFSFDNNAGIHISSGRWFLIVYRLFDWAYNIPMIRGILAIAFMSVSFCIITRILKIHKGTPIVLCAFLFESFPYFASVFTQMYMVDAYCFGMLLSCLGAYLIMKKGFFNNFIGIAFLAASLGIYQSLVIYAIVLVYLSYLNQFIICQETINWKHKVKDLIKYAVCFLMALLEYFIVLKVGLILLHSKLTDYQGINEMTTISGNRIITSVIKAYSYFFRFIIGGEINRWISILSCVFILVFAISLLSLLKNRKWYEILVVVALIALFPMVGGFIFVMAPNAYVYALQLTQYVLLYIEIIVIVFNAFSRNTNAGKKNVSRQFSFVVVSVLELCCCLTIFAFYTNVNKLYYELFLTYESSYSYYTQLVGDIKASEWYTDANNVAIITDSKSDEFWDTPFLEDVQDFGWSINREMVINHPQYGSFFVKTYLGFDLADLSLDEIDSIKQTDEYKNMTVWPQKGSIDRIDNLLIVKTGQ